LAKDAYTGEEVSEDEKIRRKLAIKEHREQEKNREIIKQSRMASIDTNEGKRQRMADLKEFLLAPGNGKTIITKALEIALNDEHPQQGTMLKALMDRMVPTSLFEEKKDGVRTAIQITISGIGEANVIEGESKDVEE
jgi:hypothetical protein